jgi:hypothetical protein
MRMLDRYFDFERPLPATSDWKRPDVIRVFSERRRGDNAPPRIVNHM